MNERCFLATYHPLIQTAGGRCAAKDYGLPPFIDGSCRREPDFESTFPSITATCRAGGFAPRLRRGDVVAYLTVKGTYAGDRTPGWRLVAVLQVVERLASHELAAEWYRSRGLALPSNCIVPGNDPKPFELTHRKPRREVMERAGSDPKRAIRLWDLAYRERVARWPVFLACTASFLDLRAPPQIPEASLVDIFGKVPGTLTPPAISRQELNRLVAATKRAA